MRKNATLKRKTPLKSKTPLKAKTPLKRSGFKSTPTAKQSLQIKRKPTKQTKKDNLWSIVTNDLRTCAITGAKGTGLCGIHVHHIFGASNKANSEKYGFLIPLSSSWHNMTEYSIHRDRKLDLKYKMLCEAYWLLNYGTKDEFIEIFGKWWDADNIRTA